MRTYGLLGKSISYSLSPKMHNAAFKFFGIDAEYVIFDRDPEELDDFFQELATGEYGGINVTIPYKMEMEKMLENHRDSLDKWAEATGSVNTVKFENGLLYGFNTDVEGFWEDAKEELELDAHPRLNVFIIGAGGVGSAISIYLASADIANRIYVYDIDKYKLAVLKAAFDERKYIPKGIFSSVESSEDIMRKTRECDLIINATPLGTKEGSPLPIKPDYLQRGASVYDLVYARETELVKAAKGKGLKAVNGLGMLVNQAALAFNIWTGKPLAKVKEVMEAALPESLRKEYGWNI